MDRAVTPTIALYLPLIETLARRRSGRRGAEYEDLVQEGMISVWRSLATDNEPTESRITERMRRWIRYLRNPGELNFERLWEDV